MTTEQLAKTLGLDIAAGKSALGGNVTGCYCGDLLSWVMSRLQKGDAWVTVMSNVNVVAVASLCEAGCIVLAEGSVPDEAFVQKAEENGVPVLRSEKPAARLIREIAAAVGLPL